MVPMAIISMQTIEFFVEMLNNMQKKFKLGFDILARVQFQSI